MTLWPPPSTTGVPRRTRHRRGPDIDFQQWLRMSIMCMFVLAAMVAVAGGFRALFLL